MKRADQGLCDDVEQCSVDEVQRIDEHQDNEDVVAIRSRAVASALGCTDADVCCCSSHVSPVFPMTLCAVATGCWYRFAAEPKESRLSGHLGSVLYFAAAPRTTFIFRAGLIGLKTKVNPC